MQTQHDYTSMSTFLTCRRKYDFRINKGYVKKVPQTAPDVGKAIHSALDSWYVDKDIEKALGIFKGEFIENPEDTKRTHVMGEWILKNYDKQYRDQPWELVSSELEFKVPLPNGRNFVGRIDKIIKWDNCLWGVDHKTTSSLGPTYFYMCEPNMQFPGYTWAAKQLGYPLRGFIIDAILVAKGLLPGQSKNSNLTPLARYDVYYKDEHLTEWLETVMSVQRDIAQCEESDSWCPNFTSCVNFIECPYRRVCKEEQSIRQRILDADYNISFWEPIGGENAGV